MIKIDTDDTVFADEVIRHNVSLWHHYPLGMIQAVWDILEGTRQYCDEQEKKALMPVFDTLADFDQLLRKNRYPMAAKPKSTSKKKTKSKR